MDRVRTFVWISEDSSENGVAGWRVEDNPYFDTVLDFGVAHDAMEHMDNMPGMDAECEAIGALIYGRLSMDYFETHRSGISALIGDFERFFMNGAEHPSAVEECPLQSDETEDHILMEVLIDGVCDGIAEYFDNPTEHMDHEDLDTQAIVENTRNHLRNGIRRAHQTFGSRINFQVAFDTICSDRAVQGECYHDYRDGFQDGDKLIVVMDPMMGRVSIDVEYVDDFDYENEEEDEHV